MAVQIRRATPDDAADGIETLRRSISELCVSGHSGDPQDIANWLSNKTVEEWATWRSRDDALLLVAECDGKVVGVGMLTLSGELILNYVHPDARFSGISKATLLAMEAELRARNIERLTVECTLTAKDFYERQGFQSEDPSGLILSKSL